MKKRPKQNSSKELKRLRRLEKAVRDFFRTDKEFTRIVRKKVIMDWDAWCLTRMSRHSKVGR